VLVKRKSTKVSISLNAVWKPILSSLAENS
jgi:hypothetical protein